MIRAVGLDVSTTAIGVALVDGTTRTIRPQAGPAEPARRLHELAERVTARLLVERPDLAVVEGYSYGGRQGRTMARLAEIGGAIRMRLFELAIPYVEVPPASLKKWATGNGHATKDAMVAAARALDADAPNDDAADAWWLRMVALCRYEPDPDLFELTPALQKLPWPTLAVSAL